jgi:uncharacterized protein (DUF1330 family)
MVAYWISHGEVSDAEAYGKYAALAKGVVASHGGQFLARATRTVWLEGNERSRNIVVQFPSVEDAVRCYESDGYQEALVFARDASVRDLCIIDGDPPS